MLTPQKRELLINKYITALDRGNLSQVEEILKVACADLELARIIDEIDQTFQEEEGIKTIEDDLTNKRSKRKAKKMIQQAFDNISEKQKYSAIYCKYDSQKGFRRYNLLDRDEIFQLDLAVAKAAVSTESIAEINNIIFFGSPNSQKIDNQEQRLEYASSIIKLINS